MYKLCRSKPTAEFNLEIIIGTYTTNECLLFCFNENQPHFMFGNLCSQSVKYFVSTKYCNLIFSPWEIQWWHFLIATNTEWEILALAHALTALREAFSLMQMKISFLY